MTTIAKTIYNFYNEMLSKLEIKDYSKELFSLHILETIRWFLKDKNNKCVITHIGENINTSDKEYKFIDGSVISINESGITFDNGDM